MYSREDLIKKIVDEKGLQAIPNLIELLDDDDYEVRELARDALSVMAPEGKEYLLQEFKRRFNLNIQDDTVLLYLAELLSDLNCHEIVENLKMMFNKFTDERAFPLIIENLLKITKDESYLDILKTYIDSNEGEIEEISIMAVTELPSRKTLDILLEKYYKSDNNSLKALILDSITKILSQNFDLVPYLQERDPDISEKLRWHLSGS